MVKKITASFLATLFMISAMPFFNSISATAMTDGNFTFTVYDEKATVRGCLATVYGEITIPDTLGGYPVVAIGSSAFDNYKELTGVVIPDSVTMIDGGAFQNCTGIKRVVLPKKISEISSSAFANCSSLEEITLPETVTSINSGAFEGCASLKGIKIPENVTYIGSSAFSGCISLKEINIPQQLKEINNDVFSNCRSLEKIDFVNITYIGQSSFENCKALKEIYIPQYIKYIYDNAFIGCSGIEKITVSSKNNVYHSFQNCFISTVNKKLIFGCKNSIIPDNGSVNKIGSYAFYGCTDLEKITLPDKINEIGEYAFAYCKNLTDLIVKSDVNCPYGWYNTVFSENIKMTITCFENSDLWNYAKRNNIPCKSYYALDPAKIQLIGATKLLVAEENNTEYSVDRKNWQSEPLFTDLQPTTVYNVYKRNSDDNSKLGEPIQIETDEIDNLDGMKNSQKLVYVRKALLLCENRMSADVNNDFSVDIIDLIALKKQLCND